MWIRTFFRNSASQAPVANALPFGAAVNSDSYRSLGAEVELEAKINRNFRLQAEYTYTDALVTQSFASSAQSPSYQSSFPQHSDRGLHSLDRRQAFRRATEFRKHGADLFQAAIRNVRHRIFRQPVR